MLEVNKQLKKSGGCGYFYCSPEFKRGVSEAFERFYKFLTNDFECEIFYKKNSSELRGSLMCVEFSDGTKINLNYLNTKTIRKEVKNKKLKIRTSFYEKRPTRSVDTKGSERALVANLIHATDAYFARLIIQKYRCLTIHDNFLLRLVDINRCVDYMNLFFRDELLLKFRDDSDVGDFVNSKYSITIIF